MTTTHLSPRPAYPGSRQLPRSRSAIDPEAVSGRGDGGERLAKALGWFSIGLGLASLAAPRGIARLIGARGDHADETILRLVGLQEVACGIGILATRKPTGWLWARVAGDAVHLSLLSGAMASGPEDPNRMAAATAAIAGITVLDAGNALQLGRSRRPARRAASEVIKSVTINRPAEELYRFWRDFRNLPRIMSHLESVEVEGETRSRWTAKAPAGMTVQWDAEITKDVPNQLIGWESVGGRVDTRGSVRFAPAPGGRGTEVHVRMWVDPPGGALGLWFAWLFGESPDQQVSDDLRHFKQVMETGEVVLSSGGFDGTHIAQRPAQPPGSIPAR
ncbi:Polyketide cyclase / dehydrase and lipid transport [Aquisphaera giovannonii]|uniref:Polyketide cyclase / dehydrase and lipid transport n=1 Tax=Aquisphaera giovannonii TaxID=406548 RepID=A0A5B9WG39_9BACT|nr:SRPBCC family protein [Aquisphaera giovannonii]QEH38810.1 Polyketide cyclase / dehydrase and lipid transport [Aquisphaera giovannonii]